MFSASNISKILESLLLEPLYLKSFGFHPSYSIDPKKFFADVPCLNDFVSNGECIWWHEEPLDLDVFDTINQRVNHLHPCIQGVNLQYFPKAAYVPAMYDFIQSSNFHVLANSEKSNIKKDILKKYHYYDWYFFYHGLAALDWYKDFKYLKLPNLKISKVFISLNHLLEKKRSYRLSLLSYMQSKQLESFGYISAPLLTKSVIKDELYDKNSWLSKEMKTNIYKHLFRNAAPKILDKETNYQTASAKIMDFSFSLTSLWHIVTETVFYEDRLHLTEKIFKPIVLKRPFIIVGAHGNLQYLKSYGFKTFDQWIDESYDDESDPDLRLLKVVYEIEKLCKLPHYKLIEIFTEMQEVLEFNFNHFYNDFKNIVIDEVIDNFQKAIFLHNKDKSHRFRIPEFIKFEEIKSLLKS